MAKVTSLGTVIDTRLPLSISREAALAVFPAGAREGAPAKMLSDGIGSIRNNLAKFADIVDVIAADDTLTTVERTRQAVALAGKTRRTLGDQVGRLRESVKSLAGQLQASFEAELASMSQPHGLSAAQAIEQVQNAVARIGGNHLEALCQVVDMASSERDGSSVLAIYRAPAWALGISPKARETLRMQIERTWSQPHVDAKLTYAKVDDYLGQVAKIVDRATTPTTEDSTAAANAEASRAARQAATADSAGGAA